MLKSTLKDSERNMMALQPIRRRPINEIMKIMFYILVSEESQMCEKIGKILCTKVLFDRQQEVSLNVQSPK